MVRFSRKGFTLAELLVSIAILATVSAVSFGAMGIFSERAVSDALKTKLSSEIADLDRAVRDGSIGSYEIAFSSGSLGFVSITDPAGITASGTLQSFDWTSASGSFKIASPTSGPWTVRLAQDGKIVRTISLVTASSSVPFSFDIGRRDAFSASFFFEADPKNRIVLRYFDPENLLAPEERRVSLASVVSGTLPYPSLTVRNVLGKKEFLVSGTSVSVATLGFAKGGKEYFVELRK